MLTRRLAARRRRRRRYAYGAGMALVVLFLGMAVWGLWQSAVRISRVSVSNGDASIAAAAQAVMQGTYFHFIPRNSDFFYPASGIRRAILAKNPGIAAISMKEAGGTALRISITDRVPLARWCGSSDAGTYQPCYVFDPNGFIFATTSPRIQLASATASSTATTSASVAAAALALVPGTPYKPLDAYVVYEPLTASTSSPIGTTLPNADALSAVFSFADQLVPFGSAVRSVSIQGGEVDDTLASGTVVRYLLGQESQALSELTAARADINLTDGSVTYVDLRFRGKVYVKKRGAP